MQSLGLTIKHDFFQKSELIYRPHAFLAQWSVIEADLWMSTQWLKFELAGTKDSVSLMLKSLDSGMWKRNMMVAHPNLINEMVTRIVEMKNTYIEVHHCYTWIILNCPVSRLGNFSIKLVF